MNITELKYMVDAAINRGIHSDTEVVIAKRGWYHQIDEVLDPTLDDDYIWFTFEPGQAADSRRTKGHYG